MIDLDFIEKIILKGLLLDKSYLASVSNICEEDYFDDFQNGEMFGIIKNHFSLYKEIPSIEIILNSVKDKAKTSLLIEECNSLDVDLTRQREWLLNETDKFIKDRAIKKAILNSVDIIEQKDEINKIKEIIETALCKTIWIDLGLNYFDQLGERLKRILDSSTIRIPTYFQSFDEMINGGFPPYTLSIIAAAIHAGKSNLLANMAARQVLHGHNVVLLSMEMSEDAFAQRFDGIYSGLDINRMYISKEKRKILLEKLKDLKNKEKRGNLFIKQFPTGEASVLDLKIYLRELLMRGIQPSILYADYVNLMKPSYKSKGDLYSDVKKISEELRAMSFEFKIPVVSVTQLNREGMNIDFSAVNFTNVAESVGLIATCDALFILGINKDAMIYESEIWCKVSKNRLGGMIGESFKFYYDPRSLKMYDETELDMWLGEANISGAHRDLKNRRDD